MEKTKHLFSAPALFIHQGLLQKHLVHLVPIHQLPPPAVPKSEASMSSWALSLQSLGPQFPLLYNVPSLTGYSWIYWCLTCLLRIYNMAIKHISYWKAYWFFRPETSCLLVVQSYAARLGSVTMLKPQKCNRYQS